MLNKLTALKRIAKDEKGAMDATVITIISIFLAAILMFIVPLMSITSKNDDIAQSVAETSVSEFVDTVSLKKKITAEEWEKMETQLESTGNRFEITIEVQHLDENIGKKSATGQGDLIGENVRYSTYTSDVLSYIYPSDEQINSIKGDGYPLKKGDIVIVTVKNTNKTIAQSLRSFMLKVTGQNTYEITATDSSVVI